MEGRGRVIVLFLLVCSLVWSVFVVCEKVGLRGGVMEEGRTVCRGIRSLWLPLCSFCDCVV